MNQELLDYFKNDDLAVSVWQSKYQLKDNQGNAIEKSPDDMHRRLAKEFARIEYKYIAQERSLMDTKECNISRLGAEWVIESNHLDEKGIEDQIFHYFKDFKYIIPQGSIMSILGNNYKVGSLSNCFVIPSPHDSYGGICRTDEQMAQLMKRRGGVGTNLSTLRPSKTVVKNAAGTSTGAASFMERYSSTTREVAQDGRRGALMLLMDVRHPDIFKFVTAKKDRTKVTGANISVMLTDKFLEAAKNNQDFYCRFPIEMQVIETNEYLKNLPYNEFVEYSKHPDFDKNSPKSWGIMKIKAKELYDLIIEMAWENAEPGLAFFDKINNYSPDGVYYTINASNPCGEQWLPPYDSCRLMAMNLLSCVNKPFTAEATVNYDKLYEVAYVQQRLADDLVDLEIEYVDAIIEKIKADPEPEEVKRTELELWENVRKTAQEGRRTGCGITALGDMLAALNLKYDSDDALKVIEVVFKTKMQAELDCSIDLAILRGCFSLWDKHKEFYEGGGAYGQNTFYDMLVQEFPEQVKKMYISGRRNISWSTVAPTGSVSIMTATSSGLEPLFMPYYMRRKKVNPNDKDVKIDFKDQNGDCWTEFAILHPKFKLWLETIKPGFFEYFDKTNNKDYLVKMFNESPWYGSTANDIDWTKRVEIQAIIQKYTTNAISSTINLPETVSKEEVANIYWKAWELGLKGVTVYRSGSRTGVLVDTSTKSKEVAFSQKDAVKRPLSLNCDVHSVKVKGIDYTIVVSILDNHPYEVFVAPNVTTTCKKGTVLRERKSKYHLFDEANELCIDNLSARVNEEEASIARLLSTSLRHGTHCEHLVNQLNKTHGALVGFSKAISRVLSKYVEAKETGEKCPECNAKLRKEEGCKKCDQCGHSACN